MGKRTYAKETFKREIEAKYLHFAGAEDGSGLQRERRGDEEILSCLCVPTSLFECVLIELRLVAETIRSLLSFSLLYALSHTRPGDLIFLLGCSEL